MSARCYCPGWQLPGWTTRSAGWWRGVLRRNLLQELRRVLLRDQGLAGVDLGRDGLAFRGLNRGLDRLASERFGVHCDIGGEAAGLDRTDRLGSRVNPDHEDLAGQVARGDRLHGAEGHLVVGGEDGAKVR